MKKTLFIFTLLFLVGLSQAQTKLGFFGGYGRSDFGRESFSQSNSEVDQTSFIPVGAQLTFGDDNLRFGAEFHYAVAPFTYEATIANIKMAELKLDQIFIGGLIKYQFGGQSARPFLRAGGGMYMGDMKIEYTSEFKQFDPYAENVTQELKSAFGFNVGAGIDFNFRNGGALFFEAVYHIVKREPDIEGATVESEPFYNYAIQAGYRFSL